MKNGKAAGYDEITIEQIKHFGLGAIRWLLQLLNTCLHRKRVPKSWRKSKVIALLKPGNDLSDPKSYRPISLLCHTYKLYERMVMNRIKTQIDKLLIPEQPGFRPGKTCTGQVLNICQHIEQGGPTFCS